MMSNDELNRFIENYLVNDKSQRALMLTAPWGTGKSYYIKNSLCPFLHKNKLHYAVVSLYGIQDLKEVNKELFLEIKLQGIPKKYRWLSSFGKTLASGTAIVGKTILKQLANVDIDLSVKEPNYEKIYRSINLKNRLIVFEDLERASVDTVEFLGYVNNLVEQDGVKVLIVANEGEIVKYEEANSEKKTKILTPKSKEYLKIKEKTIGDTIHFTSNFEDSTISIIKSFSNVTFNKLLDEKDTNGESSFIRRINQQLTPLKNYNLRSILFACQKTDDVIRRFKNDFDLAFIENLFIGTIAYSVKANNGGDRVWDSQSFTSQKLGSFAYPLFKPMHDYIEYQNFDINNFKFVESLFLKAQKISVADDKLKVLFNYYVSNEKELEETLNYILGKLEHDDEDIIHDEYVRIANYLIAVKYEVGFEDIINKCLTLMLENAKNDIKKGIRVNTSITSGIQLSKDEQNTEFYKFIHEIEDFQKNIKKNIDGFTYNPNDISNFYESLIKSKRTFINEGGFINKFDIERLIKMLKTASPSQIEEFRGIVRHIYLSFSNIKDFFLCDLPALKELVTQLDSIDFEKENIDKIQKLQINWLKENLKEVIERLEG